MNGCFFFLSILALCSTAVWANSPEKYLEAKEAARSGNRVRLQQAVDALKGHPLEPNARFLQLSSARLDAATDSQLENFLTEFPDTASADQVRQVWLKRLGKKQNWSRFQTHYPQLDASNIDLELKCYDWQARLGNGDKAVFSQARSSWFYGKARPQACSPVFDALFANGTLIKDDIFLRLRYALEAGSLDLAQSLNARLGAEGLEWGKIQAAYSNPQGVLASTNGHASRSDSEAMLVAVTRLLRTTDFYTVARLWEAASSRIPTAEQQRGWSWIAAVAARKHAPQANEWFVRSGEAAPENEVLEWRVRSALRVQNWDEVLKAVNLMSAAYQADAAWQYWKGRALLAKQRTQEAHAVLNSAASDVGFYGILAREALGRSLGSVPIKTSPPQAEMEAVNRLPGIVRAFMLNQSDATRAEAVKEWNWTIRRLSDRQLLAAAELAVKHQWYDRAIYAASRTQADHDFSLRFLAPFRGITKEASQSLNLDEAWVYGLIRQESRFVMRARSNVGASGLMQLMPATARQMAKYAGIAYSPASVNEVSTNIRLGTHYLRYTLDHLNNLPVLATAAYNAGPGRARNWQASVPLEGAIYAETIPFAETRDYVKKVMTNAVYYSVVFGTPSAPSLTKRMGVIPAGRY